MDVERHIQVQNLFNKRLRILYSADPKSPTRKGGVAIILNKRFVPTEDRAIKTTEIIRGRALMLSLKLKEQQMLKVLVIYAPNEPGKNWDFRKDLNNFFEQNPNKKPGDFNMVEDTIDPHPQ